MNKLLVIPRALVQERKTDTAEHRKDQRPKGSSGDDITARRSKTPTPGLHVAAPDLELALGLALGAFPCGFDGEVVIRVIAK